MKPVCAITGSNGYVGGCVKNHFAVRGWEILELTRHPRPDTRGVNFNLATTFRRTARGRQRVCALCLRFQAAALGRNPRGER